MEEKYATTSIARLLDSLSEATKAANDLENESKKLRDEFSLTVDRLAIELSWWGCKTEDQAERLASFEAFIKEKPQILNDTNLAKLKTVILQAYTLSSEKSKAEEKLCELEKKCEEANEEKNRLLQEVDNCKKEVADMVIAAETKLETLKKKASVLHAACENRIIKKDFKSETENQNKEIHDMTQKRIKLQDRTSHLQEILDEERSLFNRNVELWMHKTKAMKSHSENMQQQCLEITKKIIPATKTVLEKLNESTQKRAELKHYNQEYEDLRARLLKNINLLETKLQGMEEIPASKIQRLKDLFEKLESVMCSSLGTTHVEIVGCLKELLEVKAQKVALSKEMQVLKT